MKKASILPQNNLNNASDSLKKPQITLKILNSTEKVFKKPRNLNKSLIFLIKTSISLEMSSKSLFIFLKASHL
jgi:hypothetical protein